MNEIEVVVDVRPSLDSPELVVIKQRFIAEGSVIQPVGSAAETRFSLPARRVEVTLGEWSPHGAEATFQVRIRNTGFAPVDVTEVVLECLQPVDVDSSSVNGTGLKGLDQYILLSPRHPDEGTVIQPGHEQKWFLHPESFDTVLRAGYATPAWRFLVKIRSGEEELACVEAHDFRTFLGHRVLTKRLLISSLAQTALDFLTPEQRDESLEKVRSLRQKDEVQWPAGTEKLSGGFYLVPVSPPWLAFVRRLGDEAVDLTDLIREKTLRAYQANMTEAGVTG